MNYLAGQIVHIKRVRVSLNVRCTGEMTMSEDKGKISDGYHTFDELYEHRCYLFAALIQSNPCISWRADKNDDGTKWDGWFLAGMDLSTGTITYHLPQNMWNLLNCVEETFDVAPKWDGHTSADVITRLREWLGYE